MKKSTKSAPVCTECGEPMQVSRRNYRMRLVEDWAATVEDVEIRHCPSCGGDSPVFERLGELLRSIAAAVIRKPTRLAGEEITFLRGQLDLTGRELAEILGVTSGTMSRWENRHEAIGATPDRLLRTVVALKLPEAGHFEVESLGRIGEAGAPLRLVARLRQGHWSAAA
jgi:putative zinc finger/helix-turn-helix YgiT family protein